MSWLQRAEPGSDHQLAYAQALAGVATSPDDLDLLAGLLDGSAAIDGLAVDTDLRWQLLHRLVSRGAAGPAEIEAELARDRTDAGERHAAACRAAIPEPAAKAAAWAQITGGTLPNATFRAVLRGFPDPDQDELLAPYADTFYDARRPTSGGTGARTWPSSSPRSPTRHGRSARRPSTRTDAYIERADPPARAAPAADRGPRRRRPRAALPPARRARPA